MKHPRILELHAAVVSALLVGSRDALLAGIDDGFVARLPSAANHSDQILLDLGAMNSAGTLANGSVPLAIWLQNAAALAKSRMEGVLFERTLRDWQASTAAPVVSSSPGRPQGNAPTASASSAKVSLHPQGRANAGGPRDFAGSSIASTGPAPIRLPVVAPRAADAASGVPWRTYALWAGGAALVVGVIGAVSPATSQGVALLQRSSAAHSVPTEVFVLCVALAGLWTVERSGRRPIASALCALGAGCVAWLVCAEIGSLATAWLNGDEVYNAQLRDEVLHRMIEMHLGWPMGLLIGAGLLWGLRRRRAWIVTGGPRPLRE